MVDKKLETLAYRLRDLSTLRNLFSELNFDFADKPVNKDNWNDEQKKIVQEAKIIASKDDYQIYYIQTNTDSLKEWKGVSSKIIKDNNGLCMICSHNPSGIKWVFSSLSKDFSKSFSETRHVPIDINPDVGIPNTFVEFLEKLKVEKNSTSTSIASQISDAFDSFAVKIHDELTVNVFEALKVLSEGIVGDKNNNLPLTDETLEEIREPIFILLYRIIFILYAEDRGIFSVDNKIYQDEFSLKWIKKEWLLKSANTKQLAEYDVEKRVKKLFRLIEIGSEELDYDKDEFFMRSYYGRIFDRKINNKLEEWNIPNSNFLEMLSLLTRTKDKKGNYFFLDYSALETRHLGSIYEHLLEFHLNVKNKKIAELPNPKDRKTSGSYYTPKYVVDYIIKNSVEPLIKSIIEKNSDRQTQIEKILSLKILDPAMGSGHFLVGAVEYVAERICEIEFGEVSEQTYIERKRDVVRRCIYGVDINPLAVDLAKLSLWLETLSSEKPLSFLSAHLKIGNSLVGANLESIFEKQTTLFESEKGRSSFKKNVKKFLMFEGLEDDSPSAVKMKLEEYSKMRSQGTVYYDLKFLLDCKISEYFGLVIPNLGDYRAMVGENSLDFYTNVIYQKVKKLSNNEKFFHWELEFPQIFFDEEGKKKSNAGFDVILGNPPYVGIKGVHINSEFTPKYFSEMYQSATERFDYYILFAENCSRLLTPNGFLSFIMPHKFTNAQFGKGFRRFLSETNLLYSFLSLGHNFVFQDSTTYTGILTLKNSKNTHFKYSEIMNIQTTLQNDILELKSSDFTPIEYDTLTEKPWVLAKKEVLELINKIRSSGSTLNEYFDMIMSGVQTGDNKIYIVTPIEIKDKTIIVYSKKLDGNVELEKEILKPLFMGNDVKRFKHIVNPKQMLVYPYILDDGKQRPLEESELKQKFPLCFKYLFHYKKELIHLRTSFKTNPSYWHALHRGRKIVWFEQERIITPEISLGCNMTLDTKGIYHNEKVYSFLKKENNKINNKTFLGILNSKILWFFLKHTGDTLRGGYFTFKSQYLQPFCIPKISSKLETQITEKIEHLLKFTLELNKTQESSVKIHNDIEKINSELNEIVYDLYNLNEKERNLVEKHYPD